MKPEEARLWATTQVKGLSPEITNMSEVEAFHLAEDRIFTTASRRGGEDLTGSETVARSQTEDTGTREARGIPREVCGDKPIDGKKLQKMQRESDQLIVVVKSSKEDGAKGLTGIIRDDRDTSPAHRGGIGKSTKLSSLSNLAKQDQVKKFTSLAHLLTVEYLRECFGELKRDRAAGVDEVTVQEYESQLEEKLAELERRLKSKTYRPQPLRRIYIDKPDGSQRPLGIPTIEDKIVQMGVKKILEAIFEVDFLEVSYGFRPGRSCHQALDELDKTIMTRPVNYIADMDIEKFFDTVNHQWMMKFLRVRIADENFLRIIGRFLRTGYMEAGKYQEVGKGTPQGGILSPILSNIYLHYILDRWFEKTFRKNSLGYVNLIRYADDYIACFQKVADARRFWEEVEIRLNRFGLKTSVSKSKLIAFGRYVYNAAQTRNRKVETFDFLGFTHFCTQSRRGKFMVRKQTSKKKLRLRLKEINMWMKRSRNCVKLGEWWKTLSRKLTGHYRYYGTSGNMAKINAYYYKTLKLAFKWLNRRSQKRSFTWKQFYNFLTHNPLPRPKIYNLTYTLKPNRAIITEEPYEGNPQVRFCEGH